MRKVEEAIRILPERIREILKEIPADLARDIQEIRVRADKPLVLIIKGTSAFITYTGRISYLFPENAVAIKSGEIDSIFNNACGYSVHSHLKTISQGFITLKGGHRVGIAGEAIIEHSEIVGIKNISSLNIRIAREHNGSADDVIKYLCRSGLKSIIVAGPPLSGKTTMLRDMARQLSGLNLSRYHKVVIVDERNEISASVSGVMQNDLGLNTDVLSNFPKAEGIITALRTLSPDLIICDEVGTVNEVKAIEEGMNSGVKFIVSAHASCKDELLYRPQMRRLIKTGEFDSVVLLTDDKKPCQIKDIFEARMLEDEISVYDNAHSVMLSDRKLLYNS